MAVVPVSLLSIILVQLAAAVTMGLVLAMREHLRAGDPFWRVNLQQIGMFAGSALAASWGVVALWIAVLRSNDELRRHVPLWWATALGLAAGITTASCWMLIGFWPRNELILTYPLVAAAIVASYRLAFMLVDTARRGRGRAG